MQTEQPRQPGDDPNPPDYAKPDDAPADDDAPKGDSAPADGQPVEVSGVPRTDQTAEVLQKATDQEPGSEAVELDGGATVHPGVSDETTAKQANAKGGFSPQLPPQDHGSNNPGPVNQFGEDKPHDEPGSPQSS